MEGALNTGDLSKTDFPDTPIGHISKIVSEMVEGMLNIQKEFESKSHTLNFDWMFSDEALSSKKIYKNA